MASEDDAEISHSILHFLHFLERELRHETRFQEMDDVAGEILANVTLTAALENLLFCWNSLRRSTGLQTPRSHSKATEAVVYGYSDYTTATKQLYVDGTTTMGDTV